MKTIVLSIFALGALSLVGTVSAEPVKLSKEQMASVTAGTITPVKENGGGNTPNGNANGVPTVNKNPAGKAPPGQN